MRPHVPLLVAVTIAFVACEDRSEVTALEAEISLVITVLLKDDQFLVELNEIGQGTASRIGRSHLKSRRGRSPFHA